MGRYSGKTCRMATMFALTLAFFLLEAIMGYFTHSMALIADSFHMLSDVLALVIAFACMKISKKTHSARNTFGWVRAEVLGALVNTVFLVALSFSIILQSIERFFEPEPMRDPIQVLIVGILGLAVNVIGLFLFHGHGGGHGHSHGGGGHGHSHGGGGKKDKKVKIHPDHKNSIRKRGISHTHVNGAAIADSLATALEYSKQYAIHDLECQEADHDHNHDHDHDHDHHHDHHHVESGGPAPAVEDAHEELDPNTAVALTKLRRKSSKYYVAGEEEWDQIAAVIAAANSAKAKQASRAPGDDATGEKQQEGKKVSRRGAAGNSSQQLNMHGIWLHVLGDAFGSMVVIVNALVNWQAPHITFLRNYLDPMLSLMMSLIIVATSIPLMKESAMILLQTVPTHINVQEMKDKLLSQFSNSLEDVHEFHIWRLSGNKIVATAHVRCKGDLEDYMSLAEKIKAFFHYEGIHSTTIQAEIVKSQSLDSKQCALRCPKKKSNGLRKCAAEVCCLVPPTPTVIAAPTTIGGGAADPDSVVAASGAGGENKLLTTTIDNNNRHPKVLGPTLSSSSGSTGIPATIHEEEPAHHQEQHI